MPWVNRIFDKLMLVYGRDFVGRWDGVPIDSVKADWAHELSGFESQPEAIKHALLHLNPAKPPTVLEFRNLAANAPQAADIQLAPPTPDKAFRDRLIGSMTAPAVSGTKDWARSLKARLEAGDRLNANQIRCFKNALGLHPGGAQL